MDREPAYTRGRDAASVALPAALAVVATVIAALGGAWADYAWGVAWTTAAASALAGMLVARRAAAAPERGRWTCWTAAAACWLAGQLAWNALTLSGGGAFGTLADAAWWAFAVLVIGGALRTRDGSGTVRMVALVEVVPLIAAAVVHATPQA